LFRIDTMQVNKGLVGYDIDIGIETSSVLRESWRLFNFAEE